MLRLFFLVAFGVVGNNARADDIRLPSGPPPILQPDAPQSLSPDQLYIIDTDVPVTVLASPLGVVSISADTGPLKIRGKFVDGTGKTETREYKGKFVYSVEILKQGTVELLIVTQDGKVLRRTLNAPQVTPDPPKPPEPAKPTSFASKLQSAYKAAPDAASLSKLVTILTEVNAHDYANYDQMEQVLSATGKKYLPNNELRTVRDLITSEITARFGVDPRKLDTESVKTVFKEAIEALK
jgi:hypothetical protein